MPEAVSFVVTTYRKLAKDETGATQMGSRRIDLGTALEWICDELPDEAWDVTHAPSAEDGQDIVTLTIDWSKVPDCIRSPKLPARRR